ncbi:MAG: hypothetical protein WCQ67_01105 [Treponema sp.]
MEKSTTRNKKHFQRLLIFLLVFFLFFTDNFLFAKQKQTYSELRVVPQSSFCFTEEATQFVLKIPNVPPAQVSFYTEPANSSVSFVSSYKDEYIPENSSSLERGTLIQLWYKFKKTGSITPPQLSVSINNKSCKISFEPITVYENLNTVQPVLSINIQNKENNGNEITCIEGEQLKFIVYIKYAVQIISFDWELPENSIFSELKRYEITEGQPRGTTFSPSYEPVASFSWQPLSVGKIKFPNIKIVATAYNGKRYDLSLQNYIVNVMPSEKENENSKINENVFAYAFTKPVSIQNESNAKVKSVVNPQKILTLRKAERNSFPFNSVVEKRISAEKEIGLEPGENEPSIPLYKVFLISSLVLLIISVILFVLKKTRPAVIAITFYAVFLVGTVVSGIPLTLDYALFAGGIVSPIPEQAASSSVVVQPGSRIIIQKKAGEWVYIKYSDTYGWVQESQVYYIK